jgi:hypothetical protein
MYDGDDDSTEQSFGKLALTLLRSLAEHEWGIAERLRELGLGLHERHEGHTLH